MRWAPVDSADGYVLYVYRSDGVVISRGAVSPGGCSQRSHDGYTAGICTLIISAANFPPGYAIGVSAFNTDGESAPQVF